MRPIHLVQVEKLRPAVILTRPKSRDRMNRVSVAAITSRVHGLPVEVPVGVRNGLEREGVVNLDSVHTVSRERVGPQIGWFFDDQEPALLRALAYAFALELPEY